MSTVFWGSDGTAYRRATKNLWGYDGSAWRRVRKAWAYDGAAWRLTYVAATLANVSVIRAACTTTAGHSVTWTASGELTGWTVTVERKISPAVDWTVLATGLDPTTGLYSATYGGGNSQTEYSFRVSLVQGSREAFGSPTTFGPPITLC